MELDFTKLNSLAFMDFAEEAQKKQPLKTHCNELLGSEQYKTPTEGENALKRQLEGLAGLQRKADQNKAEIDRILEVYRHYQENIKTCGQLQTELLKGARAGEDIYSLFLKAVKAISCMTDNKTFYSQIEGALKTIYGRGLQEPAPLLLEIQEAQTRLFKLREAEQRETDTDSLQRIKTAIKAHENKIAELKALIAKGAESKAN